jgi:hypothetical protein
VLREENEGGKSGGPKLGLVHTQLERYLGFIIYVSQVYPPMVPYLKGIKITLYSWRAERDNKGWKCSRVLIGKLRRDGDPKGFLEA